ncbi:GntR family transcriptional regulator [Novosphingobium nitrogenifigens]|uniref:GntR family transcriptional regulator n=1 Tax=Novosphingobium nitrogenifigens TaxID=378548 RepID=UPI0003111D63|nr:GntR family transcriptional regulator [Novosphingobium nitrogenifigens]
MIPLERLSLRDGAARSLRQQIVSGALRSGSLYSIGDIAQQLGTSPTPIREALLELENDGLVELVRNRGFRIREISRADIKEIHAIRVMLEVPAIEALAAMDPVPDLSDAEALCRRCARAAEMNDIIGFLAFDRDFHLALIAKLGNRRLTDTIGTLRDQTRLYGLHNFGEGGLTGSTDEHLALLEAVRRRDPATAGALLRHHLDHVVGDWAGHAVPADLPVT